MDDCEEENQSVQAIYPLDALLKERRVPVLFVGAGISRRYYGLCSWNELLEQVAYTIGLERFQLNGLRQAIAVKNPESKVNPLLASKLRELMIQGISTGSLNRLSFPEVSDDEWKQMEEKDPFKVFVSCLIRRTEPVLTDDMRAELDSFRKLSEKIPAVITTNYDDFLEKEIFNDFAIIDSPDDFYFSDSVGYGEIMKIHGTVDRPESLIITYEDYQKLSEEYNVIISRISGIMCNSPIIFIGYSLSDEEVYNVIHGIVTSLKQTNLDTVRGHLIKVNVDPGLAKATWNPESVEIDWKRFEVTQLNLPNLGILFDYLDRFTPVATPREIRRYRSMIRDIVLSSGSGTNKIAVVDEDSICDPSCNRVAVMFGSMNTIGSFLKGIKGYDILDSLTDVLLNERCILHTSVGFFRTWLLNPYVCKSGAFVPVFLYLNYYGLNHESLESDARSFVEDMIIKMESKIEAIAPKCSEVTTSEGIDSFLDNTTKSFHRCEALSYYYSKGVIDYEECRQRLCMMYSGFRDKGSRAMPTDLRFAITYLDYKPYKLRIDETRE